MIAFARDQQCHGAWAGFTEHLVECRDRRRCHQVIATIIAFCTPTLAASYRHFPPARRRAMPNSVFLLGIRSAISAGRTLNPAVAGSAG